MFKPLTRYSREEIYYFFAHNQPLRLAWKAYRPFIDDKRGARRWVFALGWLACILHYRRFFELQAQAIAESATRKAQLTIRDFDIKTKAGLFGEVPIGDAALNSEYEEDEYE